MANKYVDAANAYARAVIDGTIPASKWIRLACERHFRDLESSRKHDWPYRFDPAKAAKACKFIELMPHIKGKWARQKIKLEPWQCFNTCSIFGWVRKDNGKRRFRRARLYVPRKNAKSTWAAGVGNYMLTADGEPGAEVYSGATTEKQAWEVFKPAKLMAEWTPEFTKHYGVQVHAKSLTRYEDGSKFEPIIGNPGDGSSPHCSITDEYHEHPTDDQLSTMETGMGAREQPLSLVISTAGSDIAGPCYDDWTQCQRVLDGSQQDEQLFALIYTIDPEDDWTSEVAVRKANPNFDVSVFGDFLLAKQTGAINNTREQGHFKTKHLNIWIQARAQYFNMQHWALSSQPIKLEHYHGQHAYLGLDLASKVDIAALEILFPLGQQFARFGRYYLPEATVELPQNQHYRKWRDEGWLTVTEGNIIDYFRILEDIKDLSRLIEILGIAYDPHQATMLVTALQGEGLPVVEFAPTVLNFSEPMKEVEALMRAHAILHNGDPVMTWALGNVVAKQDAKDNVYPRKERDENKIDPAVALIMAKGLSNLPNDGIDLTPLLNGQVMAV